MDLQKYLRYEPKKAYGLVIASSAIIQVLSAAIIALLGLSSKSSVFIGDLPASVMIAIHIVLWLSVVFFSPVIEEFVFRKFLWSLIEKVSPKAALVVTSLAFSLVHMDPVTIAGLMPISFFLGWLRLKTGSVYASILSHCSYNLTGLIIILVT